MSTSGMSWLALLICGGSLYLDLETGKPKTRPVVLKAPPMARSPWSQSPAGKARDGCTGRDRER